MLVASMPSVGSYRALPCLPVLGIQSDGILKLRTFGEKNENFESNK